MEIKRFKNSYILSPLNVTRTPTGTPLRNLKFEISFFDFEDTAQPTDEVIELESVKFFVDNQSLQLLKGAKVDYVDSLQGAGFKISNPNAKGTCGCGQSFS
ncbi:MAG: iron-sulfur cluster assembly accessory protein [Bacteroidetes bacterium]|nr:iron-sulfur cluster assembly accessory protein [Bacteroidota bacterium]